MLTTLFFVTVVGFFIIGGALEKLQRAVDDARSDIKHIRDRLPWTQDAREHHDGPHGPLDA